MSVLESKINPIATLAIDTSVNKADAASPTLYGRLSINPVVSHPNN